MHTSECIVAPSLSSDVTSLRQRQRAGTSHGSLCLTRKRGESIVFINPDGTKTVIVVSECNGGRTNLRIVSPRSVRVVRTEKLEGDDASEVTEIIGEEYLGSQLPGNANAKRRTGQANGAIVAESEAVAPF